jgi:hypothetical protein
MSREIELRDAALRIVNTRGRVQPDVNDMVWQDQARLLQIVYATPFTQYRRGERAFPYWVRIFAPDPGSNEPNPENVQVLAIEWNARSGAARVIRYRPGHWEGEIEAIAMAGYS